MKLFDLSGKVAIVTGSSRGIGRAIAEAFAEAGGRVVISARNLAPCEEAAAAIQAKGGEAIAVTARISDKTQLENLVTKTREAWGRVDILVCNAAINPHYGSLEKLTDEVFERMMVNNVLSNLWLSRMVAPEMRERRDGSIIYIISVAAVRATTVLGMYGVTKAADYALCRNLAAEWGPDNVRVNCIAPGLVKTDFARVLYEDPQRRAAREATVGYQLGRRPALAREQLQPRRDIDDTAAGRTSDARSAQRHHLHARVLRLPSIQPTRTVGAIEHARGARRMDRRRPASARAPTIGRRSGDLARLRLSKRARRPRRRRVQHRRNFVGPPGALRSNCARAG